MVNIFHDKTEKEKYVGKKYLANIFSNILFYKTIHA